MVHRTWCRKYIKCYKLIEVILDLFPARKVKQLPALLSLCRIIAVKIYFTLQACYIVHRGVYRA